MINKDIKILEEEIREFKEFEKKYKLKKIHKGTEGKKRIQALENLIARYKELEKENNLLQQLNEGKVIELIFDNYIPKSKIQEKIEELKKELKEKNWGEKTLLGFRNRIQVLQEFLED